MTSCAIPSKVSHVGLRVSAVFHNCNSNLFLAPRHQL
jgi:hypothetical protein